MFIEICEMLDTYANIHTQTYKSNDLRIDIYSPSISPESGVHDTKRLAITLGRSVSIANVATWGFNDLIIHLQNFKIKIKSVFVKLNPVYR